jgi:muconate cycloisomerase
MGIEGRQLRPEAAGTKPITISRVDAIPVALPLTKPMKMAHLTLSTADNLLVRIESSDGTVGWGEAASAPTLTGETLAGMVAVVRDWLAPALIGQDARFRAALSRKIGRAVYAAPGAKSAVEIALADLVARSLNVPMAALLGGLFRDGVEPMWLLANATADMDVDEALRKKSEGYTFFKLKVGSKPVDTEIESALAIRRAVGPQVKLCADANSGFSPASARRFLEGTADANLFFLEQPFAPNDLDAVGDLVCKTEVPICSDQSVHTLDDISVHADLGIRGVALKLLKLGGIEAMLRAAALCDARALSMVIAAKVAESSIASAAIAHVACAVPLIDWGVSLTHVYLAEDVVTSPLRLHNGRVTLPEAAGLGLTVDEAAVQRFRAA